MNTKAFGIIVFGIILMAVSLLQIPSFFDYAQYTYVHQDLPGFVIPIRYVFSWLLRIFGFVAGMGILYRVDFCRRLAIVLSCFTIFTIPLKHTYASFQHHTQYLEQQLSPELIHFIANMTGVQLSGSVFTSLTSSALIMNCLADVIFALVLVYYFTRPGVRAVFW